MMNFGGFIGENNKAIAFTLGVLIFGAAVYLTLAPGQEMPAGGVDAGFFEGMRLKVGFAPDGSMKLFASAKNNALSKLSAAEGNSVPEGGAMVIGYAEASAMRGEKLFSKPGDSIKGFFGIRNISVEGVLRKTGSPVDEMHFLDANAFDAIEGEEGRAFVKVTPGGEPKLFYKLGYTDELLKKIRLAEGSVAGYETHVLGATAYYPVFFGAAEAKLMRAEGKFADAGDTIEGFFGKNVVVAGVLEQTNASLDIMNFIPFNEKEL
ncbi:MAG: hypothetical protein AABW54_01205 [Candidatus Micrarchaeota archaeon]